MVILRSTSQHRTILHLTTQLVGQSKHLNTQFDSTRQIYSFHLDRKPAMAHKNPLCARGGGSGVDGVGDGVSTCVVLLSLSSSRNSHARSLTGPRFRAIYFFRTGNRIDSVGFWVISSGLACWRRGRTCALS